jgi:hypothetical protein
MNDTEIRLACIQAAVATAGNPNHVQQAREYYAFVTEGAQKAETASEETTTSNARKGNRK